MTPPSRGAGQRGSALVEFALMSPLLFLIASGVSDFSRFITASNVAASAAAAGTQYGALSPSNFGDVTGMQNAAVNDAGNYTGVTAVASQTCACTLGGAAVSCPATCSNQGESAETYIKVTVTIPFTPLLPFTPTPASASGTSIVRVQ